MLFVLKFIIHLSKVNICPKIPDKDFLVNSNPSQIEHCYYKKEYRHQTI